MKLRRESDYSDGVRQAVARTVAMAATLALASVDERHDVLSPSWHGNLPRLANSITPPTDHRIVEEISVNKARNE